VPLGLWQQNDRIQERRVLPPSASAGPYRIALGLYNRTTQQRLTPVSTDVTSNEGAVLIGEFDWP